MPTHPYYLSTYLFACLPAVEKRPAVTDRGECPHMSAPTTSATDLTSSYVTQVARDLQHNVEEQERISGEIAGLQEKLAVLQHNHTVLVSMQQALGTAAETAQPPVPPAAVAADDTATAGNTPAAKKPASGGAAKRTRGKGAATGRAGRKAAKPAAEKADASPEPKSAQPKLIDLVRTQLAGQAEPRSAAEIATTLGDAHPERAFKVTVVRSALENLVARNQAQRSKQGTSVFYTATDAARETPAADTDTPSAPAES